MTKRLKSNVQEDDFVFSIIWHINYNRAVRITRAATDDLTALK